MGLVVAVAGISVTQAASHREAPKIALDPAADITDVYAFRSWGNPDKVVLIMNVIPGQEPSSGPNYFLTSTTKLPTTINLDVNQDGEAEDIDLPGPFQDRDPCARSTTCPWLMRASTACPDCRPGSVI